MPAASAPSTRSPSRRVIASIEIETYNVFETDRPPENKLLYRMANNIHTLTHDYVIERELLFKVGDRYDPALVAETERNLRRLPFLRRADVSAAINPDGAVDVTVRTYDSWTLEVVASFKRAGGKTSASAGLTDHNLAGYGKTLSAVYRRSGAADSQSFGYGDPQFLGKEHLVYAMRADSSPESRTYSLSLDRPFFASIARTALGSTFSYGEHTSTDYSGEAGASPFHARVIEAGLTYGVTLATSTERTRHLKFGLLGHRTDYSGIPGVSSGPAPDHRHLGFFQLSGDWEELNFIKVRRIQKFTHAEDYNLGLGLFPSVEWAPHFRPLSTTESEILPGMAVSKGFAWSEQLLLFNSAYRSRYVNGGNGDRVASIEATYFVRGLKNQTLAVHSGLTLGWHLDASGLLSLGEENGLRGYGLSQFTGNRRFLFNVEDRIFLLDELWRLLDIGAVVFFDSGYVWPASSRIKPNDMKSSVGLGLRAAPSRSAGNSPVRIDLAYALSDNGSGSRLSLSILAGQAFGP